MYTASISIERNTKIVGKCFLQLQLLSISKTRKEYWQEILQNSFSFYIISQESNNVSSIKYHHHPHPSLNMTFLYITKIISRYLPRYLLLWNYRCLYLGLNALLGNCCNISDNKSCLQGFGLAFNRVCRTMVIKLNCLRPCDY